MPRPPAEAAQEVTAVLPRADPFTDAECRRPGRKPGWWDADASYTLRGVAAALCKACPARQACARAAEVLGAGASGTWAGRYRKWTEPSLLDDETVQEFLAIFGPNPAYNDLTPPNIAISVKEGRYWIHPAQLRLNYETQSEAM